MHSHTCAQSLDRLLGIRVPFPEAHVLWRKQAIIPEESLCAPAMSHMRFMIASHLFQKPTLAEGPPSHTAQLHPLGARSK